MIVYPIQWHEGMLLGPQHFQQNDLRQQQLQSLYFSISSSIKWGIISFQLDELEVFKGLIRIKNIKAILPDGMIIDYNQEYSYGVKLELDLKKLNLEQGSLTTIYLCLPERGNSSPIIGDLPRFQSVDSGEIIDENLSDNIIQIPILIPKLFLHAGEYLPARCIGIPVMQVISEADGFQLSKYTPPYFFIGHDHPIIKESLEIARYIRQKIIYLNERWKNQIGTPVQWETGNQLKPLMTALPELESLLGLDNISPLNLHGVLSRVFGILSQLQLEQVPQVMPAYNHNQITNSIQPYLELIKKYLALIEEKFVSIVFNNKERLFFLKLHNEYLYKQNKIFIGFRTPQGVNEYQMQDWVNDAVICSDQAVESATQKRITGAHRQLMKYDDLSRLMPARGILMYEVELSKDFIFPDQNLNIFNPADSAEKRPTEIILYLMKAGQS